MTFVENKLYESVKKPELATAHTNQLKWLLSIVLWIWVRFWRLVFDLASALSRLLLLFLELDHHLTFKCVAVATGFCGHTIINHLLVWIVVQFWLAGS